MKIILEELIFVRLQTNSVVCENLYTFSSFLWPFCITIQQPDKAEER